MRKTRLLNLPVVVYLNTGLGVTVHMTVVRMPVHRYEGVPKNGKVA